MKLSRDVTNIIRYILDNLIPPVLRESRWFMWLPFKILYKSKSEVFMSFKDKIVDMTDEELLNAYKLTEEVQIDRDTDLNKGCLNKILKEVTGENVLEVGCGKGLLIKNLEANRKVTGIDFSNQIQYNFVNEATRIIVGEATELPFEDNSFDTVICSHTLEHIKDLNKFIEELKRVCSGKLIIVVPKQRPYKYTFDLHLHFFPYEYMLVNQVIHIGKFPKDKFVTTISGDIYYHEIYN